MAKYHIKKDGTPGICRAKSKCPLGGPESHYESQELAEQAAQKQLESQFSDSIVDSNLDMEEPYSKKAVYIGKNPLTKQDQENLSTMNLDAITTRKLDNDTYQMWGKNENESITVKRTVVGPQSKIEQEELNQGMYNPSVEYTVTKDNKVYLMKESNLQDTLNEMKDKKRLKEVTDRAVHQFEQLNYELNPEAVKLQDRIRENERLGDFVSNTKVEALATSDNVEDRCKAAQSGYASETLRDDESEYVRAAVASSKQQLDYLVNDESSLVRATVADNGVGHEELIKDKDPLVRAAVVRQGYGAFSGSKDSDPRVRAAAAEHGDYLVMNNLAYDEDPRVRMAVAKRISPAQRKQVYGDDKDETVRNFANQEN